MLVINIVLGQLMLDGECDYGVCLDMIIVIIVDNILVLIVPQCDIEMGTQAIILTCIEINETNDYIGM
jgi:hypothetical protein